MKRCFKQWRIVGPALLAVCGATAAEAAPQEPSANVVLFTIDTLRADYVGVYGAGKAETPALDSLAKEGAFFENAYCQAPITPPSHASILTGTYPATHGLRDFTSARMAAGIPTMAETLREKGYATAAFISAFVLDRSWGLDAGFDLYWDDFQSDAFEGVNPGNVQRRGDVTVDRALAWLAQAKPPFFVWIHLFDPHHDYVPPEPYKTRYRDDPYAGEVAFADSQVGRFLEALKARGLYDGSLIVATSDHGEGLGDHREKEHGFFLYEETVRVPLIFKPPAELGVRGRKVETVAQTVDIFPTVLQILRAPAPETIEGAGLLSTILGKRRQAGFAYAETLYPQTTFGWSSLRAYREGALKFIDAPRPELYDLDTDPGERQNLYGSRAALANQLQAKLRRLQGALKAAPTADAPGPDAERRERLGALGYVSLDQPLPVGDSRGLADPKDRIEVYNRILEGLQAAEAGRLERSNAILGEVAKSHPDLFVVHYSLGNNLLKLGRAEAALDAFEKARSLNPDFASARINAARALALLRRDSEAIGLLEGLAAAPGAPLAARRELAVLLARNGRLEEAVRLQRDILAERPSDIQALQGLGIAQVETRDFEEGLRTLDQAIAAGADNALVRNFRGIALANLGRPEDAVASYREAIRINPQYPLPRLNLSLTLLQAGRTDEARREFAELCRLNPPLCQRYRSRFQ